MMWALTLLLGLLVVLAITVATGYFVAQEFAYMAVDRSRLKARASAGDTAAARALAVTRRTSFMLSGAQLGITVTALLVGFVAEPLIGQSLSTALGGVGVPSGVGVAIGTVAALLLSTFVQMLFGELFPKNLAIARPEPVAVSLAASTTIYLAVFGWLIKIFDQASNLLLRAFGMEPVHDVEHSATRRDLEHIVAGSRDSGELPAELSLLLDRLIDFPDEDVEHAMIPRSRVDVVRPEVSIGSVRALMSTGHSRYPVLDDDEEILGVVHLQDVLGGTHTDDAPVSTLMRPPVLVPTTMSLPDALDLLTSASSQLACVLDEYGGLAGVLTVEDLAEELVGEITDEHDPEEDFEPVVLTSDATVWEMPGDVHLDEVGRSIDRELPDSESETLGGLVTELYGALPDIGTEVVLELPLDPALLAEDEGPEPEALLLEVLEIERHVPALVRVRLGSAANTSTRDTTAADATHAEEAQS
ncbi:hemolysin family protein [Nocardioides massiliensis]|uniref:CBS domain containing-hemolysin-like protein n=1 Tax=Nocardioides massiliensis TaxID=1325935 RepID=A0ABT9NSJ3_9ACTN|nr:hemolysin family protein [Nocardioides massiliensis]MDP9823386.1 CBS domain containing-hemolysin-like protein [Nocardioides massiliensis]